MLRIGILLALAGGLAACGVVRNTAGSIGMGQGAVKRTQVEIEGTRFRARANPESGDPRNFSITVNPVAVNPDAAKAAGRYEATRYCLLTFGGSDTAWTLGPDLPIEQLPVAEDTLTLTGRCTHK